MTELRETPVVPITRATRAHYVVDPCPICGGAHRHGRVPEMEVGESTRRSAHCGDFRGEYRLKMTPRTVVDQ